MKKRFVLTGLIGATLMTGSAFAAPQSDDGAPQKAPRRPGMMMGMMPEPDKDGVITKEAMLAAVEARFAKADTNHDGTISPEERQAAAEGARRGRGGGDGSVTLADTRARAEAMFDRMDANHDGKIDQAERDALRERMMAMRGRFGGRHGPPPSSDTPPTPPPAPEGN